VSVFRSALGEMPATSDSSCLFYKREIRLKFCQLVGRVEVATVLQAVGIGSLFSRMLIHWPV
jgi:hypothetical protein